MTLAAGPVPTVDALLIAASTAAGGLTDFGDPSFRPALEKLWAALHDEADLSPVGRQLLEAKIHALSRSGSEILNQHIGFGDDFLERNLFR